MILKTYKKQQNITQEEKELDKLFISWCEMMGNYEHMTDKEINEKFKKLY